MGPLTLLEGDPEVAKVTVGVAKNTIAVGSVCRNEKDTDIVHEVPKDVVDL